MDAGRALLARRALADHALEDDEARTGLFCLRLGHEALQAVEIVHIAAKNLPAVAFVTLPRVLGEGEVGGAVDRDLVRVVEDDELAQGQVAGQRGGFGGYALLQAAVAREDVGIVVDDRALGRIETGGEHALGDGHAHGVGQALPERSGRGLDPRREAVLRVAGAFAANFAEGLDIL